MALETVKLPCGHVEKYQVRAPMGCAMKQEWREQMRRRPCYQCRNQARAEAQAGEAIETRRARIRAKADKLPPGGRGDLLMGYQAPLC